MMLSDLITRNLVDKAFGLSWLLVIIAKMIVDGKEKDRSQAEDYYFKEY